MVIAISKATTVAAAAATTTVPIVAHGTVLAAPSVEHLEVVLEDRRIAVDTNATQLPKRGKPNEEEAVIYHRSE